MASEIDYRSDVDGLRAIAVLPVVAFHFGIALVACSGGFVGVDIFFVISGYLITKSLASSLRRGTFSILDFYRRRFRRIFPALFATYAACMIVTLFLSFPDEGGNIAQGIRRSIFFSSNIFFSHAGGYFNSETQFNPMIHTWSLSVEEQFYFVFPIILAIIFKSRPQWMSHAILLMLIGSLAISEFLVYRYPTQGFYLLQSRAWELLVGALLALDIMPPVVSKTIAEMTGFLGLILIGCSVSLITPSFPFPGLWALVPCLGTASVIYSGSRHTTIVFRLLSLPPLRFIGMTSYSLYLVHWPVIVFANDLLIPGRWAKLILFCGCMALATLSWRFIEQPFRRRPYFLSNRRILPVSALAMAITAMATFFVRPAIQAIWQVPPRVDQVLAYEKFDPSTMMRVGTCMLTNIDSFEQFTGSDCLKLDPNKNNVLLLGDSHAAHLLYGLSRVHPDANFLLAAVGSCAPTERGVKTRVCAEMMRYMFEDFIPKTRLDAVVLAARWNEGDIEQVRETALSLSGNGTRVYVFGPIVEYDQSLPRLLARDLMRGDNLTTKIHRRPEQLIVDQNMRAAFAGTAITYVSVYETICEKLCVTYADQGAPLQFDYGHLTKEGSLYLASRLKNVFK